MTSSFCGDAAADADLAYSPASVAPGEPQGQGRYSRAIKSLLLGPISSLMLSIAIVLLASGATVSMVATAGGGADIPRLVNHAQLVVVIPVGQPYGRQYNVQLRPLPHVQGSSRATVEADLGVVAAARTAPSVPFRLIWLSRW